MSKSCFGVKKQYAYLLLVLLVILGFAYFLQSEQLEVPTDETEEEQPEAEEWTTLDFMGVEVDYYSHITVQDESDVEAVFNDYIGFCQDYNIPVFAGYDNDWRFDSASPYGVYEGVKYWSVHSSYLYGSGWQEKNVFCMSENGEVVRFEP